MSGLLVVFLLWCMFAAAVGWVLATIESKVHRAPPRTRNAILWSVLLGPIGWIVVMVRSNLKFASGMRADIRAQGDLARQQLRRDDTAGPMIRSQQPGPAMARGPASDGTAPSPPPAGWYPDRSGRGQRYWDGTAWTELTQP